MGKRILVVEDDPSAIRLVSFTLEQEGYEVLTASNGLEGLRRAREDKPDLLVLDVMLPGLDGFEVCRRLRADAETAKLPVLMLSAKAQEIDKTTGLKMGADDYLAKPADPAEIVARVSNLLQRNGSGGP
jgi:two-component system alkaline phosphatase synthesis response regulator PhoP